MKSPLVFIALVCGIFCACSGAATSNATYAGDTLALRYAQQLSLVQYKGYVQATLANPWKKGAVLHSYVLVPKGRVGDSLLQHDAQLQAGGSTVVRTPIAHAVVFTTSHCALLYDLHAQQALSGVCDLAYINLPDVQRRAKLPARNTAKVVGCGSSMQPDVERIMQLHPEALLVSPFEQSGGFGKLAILNIPIIETADYMETSALGRAEWMKFYGMLYGREHEADSLFAVVEQNYKALSAKAKESKVKRSVLPDRKVGAVWYLPGGESSVGLLYKDANGSYAYAQDKHSGSLSMPFETILDKFGDSDFWILSYNGNFSLNTLLAEYQGYRALKPYKTGEVYGCKVDSTPYFEEVSWRPDWLLSDLIQLFHPDLHLGAMRYYKKLK